MSLVARDVSVRIGRSSLLESASVEVRPGEIVAVAGPNGAGKTTLIRVLANDLRPASGRIELAGRPLAAWSAQEQARRRAVLGTDDSVAFGYSAREVALLGRLPIHEGDPGPHDREIVDALLEAVDCAHLADRTFTTLSTGERQRVQLARAIAQVTELEPGDPGSGRRAEAATDGRSLLLDEPTSSLDPAHQHVAMRLLRREAGRGLGVLAVLHDLNLAAAYADAIVLMRAGRVVASGPPAAVLRSDLLEAVFAVPMLVLRHPRLAHPLVVSEPAGGGRTWISSR